MFRKGFYKGWLTEKALLQLRQEICLGSLFIHDYDNSFGISPNQVCNFFDGYLSFIEELMKEDGRTDDDWSAYDNDQTLLDWYGCFEECPFTEFVD